MNSIYTLELADLASLCAEEQRKFLIRVNHEPHYCFELFRRAIGQEVNEAWEYIRKTFHTLITNWAKGHRCRDFWLGSEDDLVTQALEKLRLQISTDDFRKYPGLEQILSTLRKCVRNLLVDEARSEIRRKQYVDLMSEIQQKLGIEVDELFPSDDQSPERILVREDDSRAIWKRIETHLHTDEERLVFEERKCLGLLPQAILENHPDRFASVDKISLILERVLKRIRHDPVLHSMLNLPGESTNK